MKKHSVLLLILLSSLFFILTSKASAFYYQLNIGYKGVDEQYILTHYKIKKVDSYSHVDMLSAYATIDVISEMKKDPAISYIGYNRTFSATFPKPTLASSVKPLNFNDSFYSLIKLSDAQSNGITGKNINICVIDSGIDLNHEALSGKIISSKSFITESNGTTNLIDYEGHGTHVAGIITGQNSLYGMKGVAPGSKIYNAKVFNENSDSSISVIINAVDWCVANHVQIISMSLGSNYTGSPMDQELSDLSFALNNAYNSGIINVAAAGNDGETDSRSDNVSYPARLPNVVAVASSNETTGDISSFSNRGPSITVTAPGENIVSSYPNNEYAYMSGTSMATPVVSGIIALLKEKYPAMNNAQIINILKMSSIDKGSIGLDSIYGCGLVQATPPISSLVTTPPHATSLTSYTFTSTTVTVNWNPVIDCDILGYNIYVDGIKQNSSIIKGNTFTFNKPASKDFNLQIESVDELSNSIKSASQTLSLYFTDVMSNHWAFNYINDVAKKNWMVGTPDGKFNPSNLITRAEVATALARLFDTSTVNKSSSFSDVPVNSWAYPNISIMSNSGFMKGTSDSSFSPNRYITREEVAVILDRMLKETNYNGTSMFPDINDPSRFSYQSIINMGYYHYFLGCTSSNFCPNNQITRAEVATLIDRTGTLIGQRN